MMTSFPSFVVSDIFTPSLDSYVAFPDRLTAFPEPEAGALAQLALPGTSSKRRWAAGVMGSGIAAHFANAGVEVLLLDIVPPDLSDKEKADPKARNRFSAGGLDKALKARPAAFFHKSAARLIKTGNTEDDLGKLANC